MNHWCTGKDSNLRTSLGGTDLQSVGFNHSPTCAETIGRCSRRAPSGSHLHAERRRHSGQPTEQNAVQSHLHFRKQSSAIFAKQGNQESRTQNRAKITTRRKSSEWSAFGKTCCAAIAPRLPEIRFLELAKGFEPLTL